MERRITTRHLFKSETIKAGSAGTSAIVDLRDISKEGQFSLSWTVAPAGDAATCGTTTFSYLLSPVFDGTYATPTGGTCGTMANDAGEGDWASFSPPVAPFIKVLASVGTSATALVTAALHVR